MGIDVKFSDLNNIFPIKSKANVLIKGEDGAIFIPEVSEDGILSWTNDKNLNNPAPVNIKGDKGEQGIQGEQGPKGDKGDPGEVNINDDAVGADAWSSKNIVDRLCPTFIESGSIVTCEPVEGYPLSVVSRINPIQEGSGDPSPGGWSTVDGLTVSDPYNSGTTSEFNTSVLISGKTYRFTVNATDYDGNPVRLSQDCVVMMNDGIGYPYADIIAITDNHIDFTAVRDYGAIIQLYYENGIDGSSMWDYYESVGGDVYTLKDGVLTLQEGSAANIRPISPRSEVKVWCGGKNLLKPFSGNKNQTGIKWTANGDGSLTINGTPTAQWTASYYIPLESEYLKDGQVYCVQPETTDIKHQFRYRDENGTIKFTRTNLIWRDVYTVPEYQIYLPNIVEFNKSVAHYLPNRLEKELQKLHNLEQVVMNPFLKSYCC